MRLSYRLLALSALAAAGIAASAAASAAEPVTGRWLTEDGRAIVTIGTCGATVCGKISRILAPTPDGPPHDVNNPDPRLRQRTIEGLPILTGFVADGDSWKGRIYNPEEGKTYKSVLARDGDRLKMKGCVLFFCKTQTWTRAR